MQGPFINRQTFRQRVKQLLAPAAMALASGGKVIVMALPLLKMGASMFIAFGAYAYLWGWRFAAGAILLIFIHEMGHLIAARMVGLKVSLPLFLPFFGARILLREMPRNAWIEAIIGVGGPLFGSLGALGAFGCYFYSGNQLFLVLAYFGFFINLFNLVPIIPLDGGRIVAALSPWLWLVGLLILVPYLIYRALSGFLVMGMASIFILIIVASSLPRVLSLFRQRTPEQLRYFECTPLQRCIMALLYFGLIAGLYLGMGCVMHLMHGADF